MCQHCCYLWCYVQDTFQTGRSGPGSHTTSHLVQDVLILATNRATLDFSVSGQHPIRWFVPSVDQDDVATGGTYVLNLPRSSLNVCSSILTDGCASRRACYKVDGKELNTYQKGLLEVEFLIRVCHQGGMVVDLCCGSGSGCIAGLRMGHNVTGF